MKRVLSLFLLLVLVLTMVSGCKSGEDEELGVTDSFVEEQEQTPSEPDQKEPSKEEEKPEETPDQKEPSKEENPKQEEPKEDPVEEPDPEEEPEEQEPEGEENFVPEDPEETLPEDEKLPPVEKENSGTPITFMSQNIIHAGVKYGEKGDGTGNNLYNRLRRFKSMVLEQDPDVIFINEARRGTLDFFEKDSYFANNYKVVWKYRYYQDGYKIAGGDQAEPVLFKYKKYDLMDSGHFWLSATPNKPSKSYDSGAAYGDISSWVHIKDKQTGSDFYAYCTHFSPSGDQVPLKAMAQYHKEVQNIWKKDPDAYVFVGGDYNVYYRSEFRYNLMMNWDYIVDLRDVALNMYDDELTQLGGMASGHNLAYGKGEEFPAVYTNKPQIDYVMASPNPHMAVDYYGFDYTIYDHPEDDVKFGHISDHWGLVVKVRIDTDADYSQYQKQHIYGDDPVYFNTDLRYYER